MGRDRYESSKTVSGGVFIPKSVSDSVIHRWWPKFWARSSQKIGPTHPISPLLDMGSIDPKPGWLGQVFTLVVDSNPSSQAPIEPSEFEGFNPKLRVSNPWPGWIHDWVRANYLLQMFDIQLKLHEIKQLPSLTIFPWMLAKMELWTQPRLSLAAEKCFRASRSRSTTTTFGRNT